MRVLLVSHTCQSRTEGQPKAFELARLSNLQLRVLVPDRWRHYGQLRLAERPEEAEFDCLVGRVRWPWLPGAQFYLHYYPLLRQILQDFQPDIIDLWEEPWGLVSAHACFLRDRMLPRARIISETEQNIDKQLPPPFEWFRKYVLRKADFLVGRNAESIAVARRKGFARDAELVPNGVDTKLFRPLDRLACREKVLKTALGSFLVGYVGRLVPEKGLADFVEAIRLCPDSVHGVLVGEGEMREELLHQVAAAGLSKRVHLLPGRDLSELPEVMNALDALILPSRTTARWKEQFGRVLIEAQACGTPVIGSDSGAIPDVVREAGLVFPEQQPAALAQAIQELLADPLRWHTMSEVAIQQAALCSWSGVARQMASIYQRLHDAGPRQVVGKAPAMAR